MSMTLDQRQRTMLAEMGVRVWQPAPVAPLDTTAGQTRGPSAGGSMASPALAAGQASTADFQMKPLPNGLAHMDWSGLQQSASDCRACALCNNRNRSVFADGAPAADGQAIDWLIVGDAPGDAEDMSGKPFATAEGLLLNAMLQAMGLARPGGTPGNHSVVLVNALKCRGPAQRNPLPSEIAACRHYLTRQIQLLRPRMILALGRLAAQAVLHGPLNSSASAAELPLGKLRAQLHHAHGCPVVVSYHPSSLLRSPADKARAWSDLCLAMAHLRSISGP